MSWKGPAEVKDGAEVAVKIKEPAVENIPDISWEGMAAAKDGVGVTA